MSWLENLYWRWMDGPLMTCEVCGGLKCVAWIRL